MALCIYRHPSFEIDGDEFDELLEKDGIEVIDVRELDEIPGGG